MKREMRKLNRVKYVYSEEAMQRLLSEGYVDTSMTVSGKTADSPPGQNGADGAGQTADPPPGQNGAGDAGQTVDLPPGQNGAGDAGQTVDSPPGQNGADGAGQTADKLQGQDGKSQAEGSDGQKVKRGKDKK